MTTELTAIELSCALSSMWDLLMDLHKKGVLTDDAVTHLFNSYCERIKNKGGD